MALSVTLLASPGVRTGAVAADEDAAVAALKNAQSILREGQSRCFTRLVAPGGPIVSLSREDDTAVAEARFGTSLAAPIVAGVIALLQQRHKQLHGGLPSCDQLEQWLMQGATDADDDVGNQDNVVHTKKKYRSVDALGAMQAMLAHTS